jgi:autotransporter-associated beta strand protein
LPAENIDIESEALGSTYAGVLAGSGSLTKSGNASLTLTGANTYTGVTTINGGFLQATTLANINTASSIGKGSVAGSPADLVFGGGSLVYTGSTSATTDRLFTLGNANGMTGFVNNSAALATSTLSFTNTGAIAFGGTGGRILALEGSNTGNNTFGRRGDGPGLNVQKSAGWHLDS